MYKDIKGNVKPTRNGKRSDYLENQRDVAQFGQNKYNTVGSHTLNGLFTKKKKKRSHGVEVSSVTQKYIR